MHRRLRPHRRRLDRKCCNKQKKSAKRLAFPGTWDAPAPSGPAAQPDYMLVCIRGTRDTQKKFWDAHWIHKKIVRDTQRDHNTPTVSMHLPERNLNMYGHLGSSRSLAEPGIDRRASNLKATARTNSATTAFWCTQRARGVYRLGHKKNFSKMNASRPMTEVRQGL